MLLEASFEKTAPLHYCPARVVSVLHKTSFEISINLYYNQLGMLLFSLKASVEIEVRISPLLTARLVVVFHKTSFETDVSLHCCPARLVVVFHKTNFGIDGSLHCCPARLVVVIHKTNFEIDVSLHYSPAAAAQVGLFLSFTKIISKYT